MSDDLGLATGIGTEQLVQKALNRLSSAVVTAGSVPGSTVVVKYNFSKASNFGAIDASKFTINSQDTNLGVFATGSNWVEIEYQILVSPENINTFTLASGHGVTAVDGTETVASTSGSITNQPVTLTSVERHLANPNQLILTFTDAVSAVNWANNSINDGVVTTASGTAGPLAVHTATMTGNSAAGRSYSSGVGKFTTAVTDKYMLGKSFTGIITISDYPTTARKFLMLGTGNGVNNGDPVPELVDQFGEAPEQFLATGSVRGTFVSGQPTGSGSVALDPTNSQFYESTTDWMDGESAGFIVYGAKRAADPPAANETGLHCFNDALNDISHTPFTDGNIYEEWGTSIRRSLGATGGVMASWHVYGLFSSGTKYAGHLNNTEKINTGTNTVDFSHSSLPIRIGRNAGSGYTRGQFAVIALYGSGCVYEDYLSVRWLVGQVVGVSITN